MKYLMFLIFLTFVLELNGQQLKVTVCSVDENLPYANISINGRLLKITDSTGIAYISQDILKYGDTISSSYLGFHPAQVVYDKEMQISHICTLKHVQIQTYELEPITISGSGRGWKAFGKYVKTNDGTTYFRSLFNGNFNAEILLPDNTLRVVNGSLSYQCVPFFKAMNKADSTQIEIDSVNRHKYFYLSKYYFGLPLQLSTMGDTTTLGKVLTDRIKNSFMTSCWIPNVLRRIQKEGNKYPDRKMTYLGIKEGKRFFCLTHPNRFRNRVGEQEFSIQYLIVVNAITKEIESTSVSFIAGENQPLPLVITTSFRKYKSPKFFKSGVSVPVGIECIFETGTGLKVNLTLSDITTQFVK